MQNPIGEAELEWILHRNCEGTEQLRNNNKKENIMFGKKQQQPGNGPERFREENVGKKIAGGISIAVIVIFALILLGGSF